MRAGRRGLAAAALALGAAGCTDMYDQPKYRPLEASEFFADGSSARPLPPGTVARGQLGAGEAIDTGRSGGEPVRDLPVPVTRELLERGRERYGIFCQPCHGGLGDGNGIVVRRGMVAPPSFHVDRLRTAPAGHFFDVITNGSGAMFDYRSRIPVPDRWAIVAYVRALQLSQAAPLDLVPEAERSRLAGERP